MVTSGSRLTIKKVLEDALTSAPKSADLMDLAEKIYRTEPELIERVQKSWIVARLYQRLSQMASLDKSAKDASKADQLLLPGFSSLPQRIKHVGQRMAIGKATVWALQEYRVRVRQRQVSVAKALDQLIELMIPYAAIKRTRYITVREVLDKEREKLGFEEAEK